MHFLIDADSIVYKAGCANETRSWYVYEEDNCIANFEYKKDAVMWAEDEGVCEPEFVLDKEVGPLNVSLSNVNRIIEKIIKHERCSSYQVYIGSGHNFRYDIDPDYKGHRDPINRPIHEKEIRNHLIKRWKAIDVKGIETDDRVSIECCENPDTSVIVSIDKDLNNTPGWHYNYDKEEMYFVTDEDADLHFYRQMLMGDAIDGIKGVKGIGKDRSKDILPHPLTTERLCSIVWKVYQEKDYDWDYFIKQGQLLWMLRRENEMWNPPISQDSDVFSVDTTNTTPTTDAPSVQEE